MAYTAGKCAAVRGCAPLYNSECKLHSRVPPNSSCLQRKERAQVLTAGIHAGTLAAQDDAGEAVSAGTECEGLAWYATAPATEFAMTWTSPECTDVTDVTVYGTASSSPVDYYRTAEVRTCILRMVKQAKIMPCILLILEHCLLDVYTLAPLQDL